MPQFIKHSTIITFQIAIDSAFKEPFVAWQSKLSGTIAEFPGFVSLEFMSLPEKLEKWTIVQRFSKAENAIKWRKSSICIELIKELEAFAVGKQVLERTEDESNLRNGVTTELIVTQVSPEQEKAYQKWSAKIHEAEAKFPGFRGVYVQSPHQNQGRNWITLLQFDTSENLDRWLESPERQEILKESLSLTTSLESHRVISPYGGWFASIAKIGEVPPLWKQTMIILLVLFPIVMLEFKYLNPLTKGLETAVSMFIGNAISVTLISFPMMPIAIWFLGWWLSPGSKDSLKKTIIGTGLVILLYLIEIIIFLG